MPSDMGVTFHMNDCVYLDEVSSAVYDYGDRVEVLVGIPSEMQLPAGQGIDAAYQKACSIAEACGYVAVRGSVSLSLTLHSGSYVLFWDEDPEFKHLLSGVTCVDTLRTVILRRDYPELWRRLASLHQSVSS